MTVNTDMMKYILWVCANPPDQCPENLFKWCIIHSEEMPSMVSEDPMTRLVALLAKQKDFNTPTMETVAKSFFSSVIQYMEASPPIETYVLRCDRAFGGRLEAKQPTQKKRNERSRPPVECVFVPHCQFLTQENSPFPTFESRVDKNFEVSRGDARLFILLMLARYAVEILTLPPNRRLVLDGFPHWMRSNDEQNIAISEGRCTDVPIIIQSNESGEKSIIILRDKNQKEYYNDSVEADHGCMFYALQQSMYCSSPIMIRSNDGDTLFIYMLHYTRVLQGLSGKSHEWHWRRPHSQTRPVEYIPMRKICENIMSNFAPSLGPANAPVALEILCVISTMVSSDYCDGIPGVGRVKITQAMFNWTERNPNRPFIRVKTDTHNGRDPSGVIYYDIDEDAWMEYVLECILLANKGLAKKFKLTHVSQLEKFCSTLLSAKNITYRYLVHLRGNVLWTLSYYANGLLPGSPAKSSGLERHHISDEPLHGFEYITCSETGKQIVAHCR